MDAVRKRLAHVLCRDLEAERDRLREVCARIAAHFPNGDPLDLDQLPAQVWLLRHDHDEMAKQLDRADELRDHLHECLDRWSSEAATLTGRNGTHREDRIYGQACRDHVTEIAQYLRTESPD